jgi:hypothetical protein
LYTYIRLPGTDQSDLYGYTCMKYFFQIFLFIISAQLLTSCQPSLDKILAEEKLVPVEIRYEVGDDGHDIFRLRVKRIGNRFFAEEIQTDNFSWPQKAAYLKNDSLTETQINNLRAYLLTASTIPDKCDEIAAVTQLTRITYSKGEISSDGACDWKGIGYYELRKSLFNISE